MLSLIWLDMTRSGQNGAIYYPSRGLAFLWHTMDTLRPNNRLQTAACPEGTQIIGVSFLKTALKGSL